jgi:hypothetical protein
MKDDKGTRIRPKGLDVENGPKRTVGPRKEELRFVPPAGPRSSKVYRELFLVKWTAWLVIAVFILLVIWVIWALATHEPSRFPVDSD